MRDKVSFLNICIDNFAYDQFIQECKNGLVLTPNVDHLVKLQSDKELWEIYNTAEYIVCDSVIVQTLLKFYGIKLRDVIRGSSLFFDLCEANVKNPEFKVFLMGGKPGAAKAAKKKINAKLSSEVVVGTCCPDFNFESNESQNTDIISAINDSDATVLLVGLGCPKQEKWINNNRQNLSKIKLFLPLGATIDFEGGLVKRAPKIIQNCGLEWLFRIFQDPRRLMKRYLLDDIVIFYYYLLFVVGRYKNPHI